MKKTWIALMLLGLVGCSAVRSQTMPIAKESASAGEGQSVTFKGKALPLEGTGIKVGDRLPAAVLAANDLSPVNLAETGGKVRIISVVPSLDTPVCEEQTHALSERNGGLDKEVQLITVSMDLPFAQKRFSKEAKIGNVLFLSDYKGADFGRSYGLLIQPLHLLSRAVLVVDKENVVRHLQVVPEITELPDLEAAMQAAKGLL
ncbi:MAG: thiol peroxidase [Candidatus Manganitrophus sp. SA1]|nr:thiol peroxidase [Candidatus Manganitrophus morganii]